MCWCISSICFGWKYPSAPLIVASHFLQVADSLSLTTSTPTWLLKVLIGSAPRVSDFQQTGFHSLQIHLRAVALWVVCSTLAPAVIVPAHELAFLITADVAESSLHKASPQILRENGLETCDKDGETALMNTGVKYMEFTGGVEGIFAPFENATYV